MSETLVISTAEVARRLHVAPSTVTKRVERGLLHPARKLPGRTGAYLFDPAEIDRLAAREEAKRRHPAGKGAAK
ncbi:helix-turn-helix domain-containing protein [Dermabacteraceae bacterium P7006]